jgi:hypothetical protein
MEKVRTSKFVALLNVLALCVVVQLGNFWYTYGLWPSSWTSFVGFALAGAVLTSMLRAVLDEK